ncbi:pilus assembly protein [Epibacterium ulvae]|uniref:TadE/TadG family type IV pilus assembly protein n=1 Tax=Epibacterium ulvae TaxID=1156985 RepID=UPI001BFCA1E8|nr:TadE/TadG family type IV pilus assembly protein [Epibacterium ulvae]MBT8154138.1 pilus assembly protein [Epibacterium ulvae]
MIRSRLAQFVRRFRRNEEGSITVEFVIFFPLLLLILMTTIELGLIQMRGSMLERALDLTVRELRLGTGVAVTHDDIRDDVCSRAGFIDDCETQMRLELVQLDPFNWTDVVPEYPDCVDSIDADTISPVRSFENGQSNELMFVRACIKFNPFMPTWGLGAALPKDADGRIRLYAASAFVQEPR